MSLAAFAVALVLPAAAHAFIPPAPLPEVGWDGPGAVCEDEFTLTVTKDEYARLNPQLELWYPLAYTVKAERGWFTVSVETRRPDDKWRGARLRKERTGVLYAYKPDDTYRQLRRYVFIPNDAKASVVMIVMHPADPGGDGWRDRPTNAFAPGDDAGVLERLRFGRVSGKRCLNPRH